MPELFRDVMIGFRPHAVAMRIVRTPHQGLNTHIEIDGGVNSKNAKKLVDAGADVLVAGSFVFKSQDPKQTVKELKQIANS